ncbi:MAG: Peptidyl-tRNA hydrolase [Syntrophorhabdus sp. PtaU1.Bin153]|nr:MAG: Peptidyl-tRNA hydrolase [Syntrophorhabdus sp. PtaU1.Bin153]
MFLLCGLGNKGSEYAFTRHNIGYLLIDRFSEKFGIPVRKRLSGCKVGIADEVILAKPNTFMNLSGGPISSLLKLMKLQPENLVLIHDDLDMTFGKIRIKWDGRDGGHRGVRSVIDSLQSKLFYRMKIGIGRDSAMAPEDYVLSGFTNNETEELADTLDTAVDALHTFVYEGKEKAMSIFNRSPGI